MSRFTLPRSSVLWFLLWMVLATVPLMLLLRAGDAAKVPQTRIESDVPVLIDGVPHRCDFQIVSDSDDQDSASAICEENTDG